MKKAALIVRTLNTHNSYVSFNAPSFIPDYEKALDRMTAFYRDLIKRAIPCDAIYDEYYKKVHHIVFSNVYRVKVHNLAIAYEK